MTFLSVMIGSNKVEGWYVIIQDGGGGTDTRRTVIGASEKRDTRILIRRCDVGGRCDNSGICKFSKLTWIYYSSKMIIH